MQPESVDHPSELASRLRRVLTDVDSGEVPVVTPREKRLLRLVGNALHAHDAGAEIAKPRGSRRRRPGRPR